MSAVTIFDDRETSPARVTCIIPFRYLEDRPDAVERFRHPKLDIDTPSVIHFLVVDDGSDPERVPAIRNLCKKLGYSYIYLNTSDRQFSVGRCRNIGAQYSRSQYIFMQDIDLMPYPGFYKELLAEISIQDLDEDPNRFLMIPYIFLTELGTEGYLKADIATRKQLFLHYALIADKGTIEKYSSGTSANVYNRIWYLQRGGNDADFEGWGYEDIEFNSRAIRTDRYFPIARDWAVEKFNFNSVLEWKTYKATYRLHGDLCLFKGIVLFHAWHPVVQASDYMLKQAVNRDLFIKKLKEFPKTGVHPPVLPSFVEKKWICFRQNAFTSARQVRAALGQVIIKDENTLSTPAELTELLKSESADGLVFFNPYQTPKMQKIYEWVRSLKIDYLVAERGALPGSSFFDTNGFLADSKTYSKSSWNARLTRAQSDEADIILDDIKEKKPSLESQSKPVGPDSLRRSMGIPQNNKVIFVALQRPGDTVTRFFLEDISYADYLEQIRRLDTMMPNDVTLVIKKHPLEDELLDLSNVIYANDANIYDLIQASDLVWTFNSGVGILAMLFGKPVAYSGKAFYAIKEVNWYCSTAERVLDLVKDSRLEIDKLASLQFLRHLAGRVYSFGEHVTKPVRMPDGSRMTATTDILYEILRLPNRVIRTPRRTKPKVTWDSFLFDRYRFAEKHYLDSQKKAPIAALLKNTSEVSVYEPIEMPMAPTNSIVNEACDNDIRSSKRFQWYYSLYSRFLSPAKAEHLWNRPSSFLSKAKHPASRIGKILLGRVLLKHNVK
ncbi:capsular polysaccharide export protein, LipB/KpsS family [Brucella pituitosa]|uniref:capsular polysaccharide export protein, LipB/KpsS family n=1 Tax=Brucella pituitosa TaxID=571256 RepID=UPI003F4AF0B3